jgi:hypothetical protein
MAALGLATVAEAVFFREFREFWLRERGLRGSNGRHPPGQHGFVYIVWDGLNDSIVEAVRGSQSYGWRRQPWRGAESP